MSYDTPITDEEKAALTPAQIDTLIAQLEARKEELLRPVPQAYPKWVDVGGVSRVVESEAEEHKLTEAAEKAS